MFEFENPVVLAVGGLVLAGAVLLLWRHFSAEAREQRRRDRSHGGVTSRRHGLSVRLAVDIEKNDRQ